MRTTVSIGVTQILPSPILSVRAAVTIVSRMVSVSMASTRI